MRDLNFEFRDSLRQCDPDDIRIDFEISVHQVMPHADNAAPRDGGVTSPELDGQSIARFADDLQTTHHPCLRAFIRVEGLPRTGVALDAGDSIEDIQQTVSIASHRDGRSRLESLRAARAHVCAAASRAL